MQPGGARVLVLEREGGAAGAVRQFRSRGVTRSTLRASSIIYPLRPSHRRSTHVTLPSTIT